MALIDGLLNVDARLEQSVVDEVASDVGFAAKAESAESSSSTTIWCQVLDRVARSPRDGGGSQVHSGDRGLRVHDNTRVDRWWTIEAIPGSSQRRRWVLQPKGGSSAVLHELAHY